MKRIFWSVLLAASLLSKPSLSTERGEPSGTENIQIAAAHARILAGSFREAVRILKKVDPVTQEDIDAINYLLGSIYLGIGDPAQALNYLSLVGDAKGWFVEARLSTAEALLDTGRFEDARGLLAELASSAPGPRLDYLSALQYELQGRPGRADAVLEQSARIHSDSDLPVRNIARMKLRRGELDAATELLVAALAERPASAGVAEELGLQLARKGDYEGAARYARRALALYRQQGDRLKAVAVALRLEKWSRVSTPVPPAPNTAGRVDQQSPVREKIESLPIRQLPELGKRQYPPHFSQFPFPKGSKIRGGSGIVIDGGKKVITNRHVIEGGKQFAVRNGLGDMSRASLLYASEADDLAILSIDQPFSEEKSFDLRYSRSPEPGSQVVVMGYPLWYLLGGATPSITNGVVAKATGFNEDPKLFQLTAKVNKGNSGGPVFDLSGNLIGITQGKLDTQSIQRSDGYLPEDVNFAIPTYRLTDLPGLGSLISASSAVRVAQPMQPQDIYREMTGKVVMVAVVVD